MSALSKNAYEVLGRAIADGEFRVALFTNPRRACEQAGIPLSDAEYAAIANFDRDTFEAASRDLSGEGAVG